MSEASEYRSNIVDFPTSSFGDRGGGGGLRPPGDGGGIEARIARVESDVAHIHSSVNDIKQDIKALEAGQVEQDKALIRIEEQIKHLPTKSYSIIQLAFFLALIGALTLYSDNIRSLINVS